MRQYFKVNVSHFISNMPIEGERVNLEKEVTPVQTIVLWSLVITSLVGIAIMAFQLIVICFKLAKMNAALQAAHPDRDNNLYKDVMILTNKVAALES